MVLVSYYKGFKLLHTAFKDLGVVHLGMLCPSLVFNQTSGDSCMRPWPARAARPDAPWCSKHLLSGLGALGLESDGIFIESFRGWGVQ